MASCFADFLHCKKMLLSQIHILYYTVDSALGFIFKYLLKAGNMNTSDQTSNISVIIPEQKYNYMKSSNDNQVST